MRLGGATLLVLSGQVALDDDNRDIVGPGDMTAQAERTLDIVGQLLAAHGATFADVINIRTYLNDMAHRAEYAAVRGKYFTGDLPISTTVEVSKLFRDDALIEIEVTAVVSAT
ncbi:Enamine deaminase RidA, house cleaning of reactive enamine intermediates, YjgF/YER057c/UK114 family [Micromonospora haikouensis]|uniref:Enamine deaminase RidA, house cleaning of reactive enamine intermediates, YjgF/YER057c/UK114 family n=1 Tax=Micromonospora haikouensis TaxID=686309 RepID=A0A1C4UDJ6_9ACTN|nr:RidA family protein [Micromonospora haikouensis]SCE69765.1 Enamine deaminase RidA, house cleaning of reactive enamine intermediates, YjgF/YER057c/UK114 family [Micromonospora haikouensis]